MPKKSKIEKEYESFEASIEKIAEEEIKKIGKEVEKIKKEAEKVGAEIESSMAEKALKARSLI